MISLEVITVKKNITEKAWNSIGKEFKLSGTYIYI